MTDKSDLWVFGYGSLMWSPGFDYVEKRVARLDGFQRRFALWSWHYRGTRERPGLVLGLDWAPGAACTGIAFRVPRQHDRATRAYLQDRELVSYAYFETIQSVALIGADGTETRAEALCYILDRAHPQYAGAMAMDEQARIIAGASGLSGPNAEYLTNTCAHLTELALPDPDLAALDAQVSTLPRANG